MPLELQFGDSSGRVAPLYSRPDWPLQQVLAQAGRKHPSAHRPAGFIAEVGQGNAQVPHGTRLCVGLGPQQFIQAVAHHDGPPCSRRARARRGWVVRGRAERCSAGQGSFIWAVSY